MTRGSGRASPEIARMLLERWAWIAGTAVGLLLLWIASCALCSPSGEIEGTRSAVRPRRAAATADAEMAALRMALDREVEARERLALELESLRAQIVSSGRAADDPRATDSPSAAGGGAQRPMFDRDALVAAGIDPRAAQDLRGRWEGVEMEKIRLGDRARREGWAGTAQHGQELRALDDELRQELSQAEYDRYLYATGKANRARVTDVIGRSPADDAGFEPGDTLLSYDGDRIFSIEEIRDRATGSRPGDSIRVEVLRDGERLSLNVPGGPLGLMLAPERQAPR